MINSDSETTP